MTILAIYHETLLVTKSNWLGSGYWSGSLLVIFPTINPALPFMHVRCSSSC